MNNFNSNYKGENFNSNYKGENFNSNYKGKNFNSNYKGKNFNSNYKGKNLVETNFNLWVKQTYNNIFLTISDLKGNVRFKISGGFSKLKGSNRNSVRSVDLISQILFSRLESFKSFKTLGVYLLTPTNKVLKALINNIGGFGKVSFFVSRIKIPHNGLRSKKLRRL